jgi:hypothetical protein
MKNLLLLFICSFLVFSVNAQDDDTDGEPLLGPKGQRILPEAGDIGLGVNVIPFFNWFGNAFNNNSNNLNAANNKFFTIFGNSVLMGKYMLTDKSAIRVNFGFNAISTTTRVYVNDDSSNDPLDKVIDSRKTDNGAYTLALGYEVRRGKRRIQGYFGADLIFSVNQTSGNSYSYGNGYSNTNVIPTSNNFGTNISSNKRVLDSGSTTAFGVGLRGFIGVEYFIAPKLSCGVEFGWGVRLNNTFESTASSEYYEATTGDVMIENTTTGSITSFSAGVDNFNGAVFMMFYF